MRPIIGIRCSKARTAIRESMSVASVRPQSRTTDHLQRLVLGRPLASSLGAYRPARQYKDVHRVAIKHRGSRGDTHSGTMPAGHSISNSPVAANAGSKHPQDCRFDGFSRRHEITHSASSLGQAAQVPSRAGLLPMPTMNKRCPESLADAIVRSIALIPPSVTNRTSLLTVCANPNVDFSAVSI